MQHILLVEDHDLIRLGLVTVLERLCPGRLVIRPCGTLRQALLLFEDQQPGYDLVILDLNLPDTKGLESLRCFMSRFPTAHVVVLSGSADAAISEEAMAIGAHAYLHKTASIDVLGESILQCLGRSQRERGTFLRLDETQARRVSLRPKEIEVLNLVLQGYSNQEIGEATQLKLGTVKNYISVLLTTFNVSSRTKLVSLFS